MTTKIIQLLKHLKVITQEEVLHNIITDKLAN